MKLPSSFTTVTPLSRMLFLVLACVLPFWGFYIGSLYMGALTYEREMTELAAQPPKPLDKETAASKEIRNELEVCIADVKAKVEDNKLQFEKGTILVSFSTTTNYQKALAALESYSLHAATTSETAQQFSSQRWLTVKVPQGEEYRWACILKKDQNVVYSSVNQILDLHE